MENEKIFANIAIKAFIKAILKEDYFNNNNFFNEVKTIEDNDKYSFLLSCENKQLVFKFKTKTEDLFIKFIIFREIFYNGKIKYLVSFEEECIFEEQLDFNNYSPTLIHKNMDKIKVIDFMAKLINKHENKILELVNYKKIIEEFDFDFLDSLL